MPEIACATQRPHACSMCHAGAACDEVLMQHRTRIRTRTRTRPVSFRDAIAMMNARRWTMQLFVIPAASGGVLCCLLEISSVGRSFVMTLAARSPPHHIFMRVQSQHRGLTALLPCGQQYVTVAWSLLRCDGAIPSRDSAASGRGRRR